MEAKVISRGAGRSAVAAAAYMSCSQIYNDYDGVQHDYTRKQGLVWQKVFLPESAPKEWEDRSVLWNAVEANEKTKDSRLAREFVVALPIETPQSWRAILSDYIKTQFVSDGMCADVCIHDTDGHNPHAHIMVTVRPLDENGHWQYKTEKEYLCVRGGEERGFTASEYKSAQAEGWEKQYQYKVGKKKVYMAPSEAEEQGYERASKYPKSTKYGRQNPISERWNSEEQLLIWRKAWADVVNKEMESWRLSERIDHRSHAERGLEEQPTVHEGVAARAMEDKDMVADRCELNRQIKADNALLCELKEKIRKLKQAVMESIPAIAEMLETLRDKVIMLQYQFMHNSRQVWLIGRLIEKQTPLFQEYHSVQRLIKAKQEERKSLVAERDNCGPLKVVTVVTLTKQITTLTEDIEELKSKKGRILSKLGCTDDKEALAAEKRIPELERTRERLKTQQEKLPSQANAAAGEYIRAENAVPAEHWNQVIEQRKHLFMDHWQNLLERLKEIYGQRFNRGIYDDARRYVSDHLPERKQIPIVHDYPLDGRDQHINYDPDRSSNKRKQDLSL